VRAAELALAAALAGGAALLEARGGGALAARALAPDLLLVAAVATAGRPGGSLGAAAALGLARDAIAGGPAGAFALGFALAGLLARAALGGARQRGLASSALLVFVGGLVAYGAAGFLARAPASALLRDALRTAAASAALAPAITVPLAALEAVLGRGERVDLSAKVLRP
jgi:hypothetical protein